jgi:hypothetical protein
MRDGASALERAYTISAVTIRHCGSFLGLPVATSRQSPVRASHIFSKLAQPSPQLHDLNCGRNALAKSGGKATVELSDDRVNVMTKSSLDLRGCRGTYRKWRQR